MRAAMHTGPGRAPVVVAAAVDHLEGVLHRHCPGTAQRLALSQDSRRFHGKRLEELMGFSQEPRSYTAAHDRSERARSGLWVCGSRGDVASG